MDTKRQLAFDTLKDYLTKSPVLVYPDPNKTYHLFTDASMFTWSAILMQDQNPTTPEGELASQLHPTASKVEHSRDPS